MLSTSEILKLDWYSAESLAMLVYDSSLENFSIKVYRFTRKEYYTLTLEKEIIIPGNLLKDQQSVIDFIYFKQVTTSFLILFKSMAKRNVNLLSVD